MRQFFGIVLFGFGLIAVSAAFAQSTRNPMAPRLQLRAVEQGEPTLRDALNDESVQASLAAHVRGIDTRNPFATYRDFRLTAPLGGEVEEFEGAEFRTLRPSELDALQARGTGNAPRRLQPGVTTPPQPDTQLGPIQARPVDRGDGRPHLDVNGFATQLHALLSNNVNGYVMRLRQHGQTIYTLQWNWAQRPEDAGLGWNPNRRQHVASVSKLVTAMGLAHMLDAQGIDFDTPIIDYLPDYWQTGPNIENITFAHLMNHISGFHGEASGNSNFILMRSRVAQGVPANDVGNWGTADYENMNFGLCRILMATLGGSIDTDATFGTFTDVIWNWISIVAYANYINDNIFAPANVGGPVLVNTSDGARAYAWNDTGQGWDSGVLTNEAGGAGWHMSADEILDVVGEFRRGGGIVSSQRAMEILNASYGLNSPPGGFPAPTGTFFYKMGRWWNGPPDLQAEQSVVMVLPEDMELVVLVNSPLGPNDVLLQDLVGTVYLVNIVE